MSRVELAGQQPRGQRHAGDDADVAPAGLLEEQLGGPLAEQVEDDLDGRDAGVLDRLQRLLDLLDGDAVARDQPVLDEPVAGLEHRRRVVGVPRRAVQLDEVDASRRRGSRGSARASRGSVVGVLADVEVDAPRHLGGDTSRSLRSASRRPIRRSERPSPYTSAVSMKVTPASTAAFRAASDSPSSVSPQDPPMAHAPKPISETSNPVLPSRRVCIAAR